MPSCIPGDDDYNAGILDAMVVKARGGHDIVCASRSCRPFRWSASLAEGILVRAAGHPVSSRRRADT